MKNDKFDLDELMNALETIRLQKYPFIKKEVLEAIVEAEIEYQDDRTAAAKKVQSILEEYTEEVK